jgi:hypothetical protein
MACWVNDSPRKKSPHTITTSQEFWNANPAVGRQEEKDQSTKWLETNSLEKEKDRINSTVQTVFVNEIVGEKSQPVFCKGLLKTPNWIGQGGWPTHTLN